MQVETLLPLGKTDPGLRSSETPLDFTTVTAQAQLVEALGYDSLCVEETKTDPYIVMALPGQVTTRLGLTSQTWGCCPDLGWKVVRIHIPTTHGKVLWSCR